MEQSHHLLLLGAALLLLSLFAGLFSSRFGAPLLLVFLGLGMLAGEDGPGGVSFDDFESAYLIGSAALAAILFDGGLRTRMESVRRVMWPALTLSTLGVLLTTGLVGGVLWALFPIPLLKALLIGAIVASTDAAAVFGLLQSKRLEIHARVRATLEVESGINDPMAIFLTVFLVELLRMKEPSLSWTALLELGVQMGGGLAFGLAGGWLMLQTLRRADMAQGLYPVLALAGALFVFAAAQSVHASGYLAVYVVGLITGNQRHRATQAIEHFQDAFAWLAQIVLFLMLGLLVTPSQLLNNLPFSLTAAAVLIFLARPAAVALCLRPFHFAWKEIAFVAWVGLRGAVPIFLATVPVLAGTPGGKFFFAVAFVVVLASLVIQGWSVAPAARILRLDLPPKPKGPERLEFDLPGVNDQDTVLNGYAVAPDSAALGRSLGGVLLPASARILLALRDGKPMTPDDVDKLAPGDYLMIVSRPQDAADIDRALGPRGKRAPDERGVLGAFGFEASTPIGVLSQLYGVDIGAMDPTLTCGETLRRALPTAPEVGDRAPLGEVALVVREIKNGRIVEVGLDLEPDQPIEPAWIIFIRRAILAVVNPLRRWRRR